MKKTMIATVVALTVSTAVYAEGAEQADKYGVDIFGSVEQAYVAGDNVKDGSIENGGDTYVGLKGISKLNGTGLDIFGKLSFNIDTENLEADTRTAYLGIGDDVSNVKVGQMANVRRMVSQSTVDIFEGETLEAANQGMPEKTIMGTTGFGDVAVVGSATFDTTNNTNGADQYELAVSKPFGDLNVIGGYAENRVTSEQTYLAGVSTDIGNLNLGGLYERTEGVDKYSVATAYKMGDVTAKAGYMTTDDADKRIVEANYTAFNSTNLYVNVSDDSRTSDDYQYMAGVRFMF